ncbi:hypothetical protein GWK47_052342 [Chionoecetes opilio]|uniref:Uncharacterized protein n=1 Tax=Chionoecetes opilio TaxID=41210 RepID=A0A8J4Y1R9_CHIOP|nr:hypothetical protein GWK47_052342 [Chionoecetes opilio]
MKFKEVSILDKLWISANSKIPVISVKALDAFTPDFQLLTSTLNKLFLLAPADHLKADQEIVFCLSRKNCVCVCQKFGPRISQVSKGETSPSANTEDVQPSGPIAFGTQFLGCERDSTSHVPRQLTQLRELLN